MISADDLTRDYGAVRAVDRVSLEVEPGEIYALLGLNGAGKTTLIRMLLGMIRPTAGSATVLDAQVTSGSRSAWPDVGYLVEGATAYPELTVRENLEVVRRLRRLPPVVVVDEVIERLCLSAYADRRARALSTGNLQRLALAKALIHRPRLLILDEPVNALDPAGVMEIRTLLLELARDQGTTVFLSSHLLAEVTRLATRIGIMHHGRLLQELDDRALVSRLRRWLVVETRETGEAVHALERAGLEPTGDGPIILTGERAIDHPERVASLLVHHGCPPTRLTVEEEDLETYFLRVVATHASTEPKTEAQGV